MIKKNNILFIGSFLSKTRGTIGISERLSHHHNLDNTNIILSSSKESKWQRLLEIVYSCIVFSGNVIHIDVFSEQAFSIAEISGIIARFRAKKIIFTLRGGKLPYFYQNNPKRVKSLLLKANRILTPSLYLRQFFQEEGFTIDYLPNSIDLGRFPYAVERERCNTNKLLWVRAFSPIYQPALAVETLYHVRKQFPEATLTMVGPDKGELQKVKYLITELHLEEAVEITGPVPNDALSEYYHRHSVFLNTTTYESFGMAVLEAAACGIPIVSTPAGEIPLIWQHNENILITEDWIPELVANKVIRLLEDKGLSDKLRFNARKKAEQFDWEFIKNQWLEVLS